MDSRTVTDHPVEGIEDPGASLRRHWQDHHPGGLCQGEPTLRILYLCYNSSVEKAAKGKFPAVRKTAHSLAHAVYGIQYAHKKTKNLRLTDIARGLDTQDWELVRDVLATLNNYMASADASSADRTSALPRQGVPHQCPGTLPQAGPGHGASSLEAHGRSPGHRHADAP